MTPRWPSLRGTIAYEFRMQIRRLSVWLMLLATGALSLSVMISGRLVSTRVESTASTAEQVAEWAFVAQLLLPIGFGVLLADRVPRDRRLHTDELLAAMPIPDWATLAGKYLGGFAATLVPIVLVYTAGLAWLASYTGDTATVLGIGIPSFVVVNLPGLLFVAGFSIVCPIVFSVPVYQFLFVGYWFWGNLLSPQVLPTISNTWLTPIGKVARSAFIAPLPGETARWSALDAAASISLLLVGSAVVLIGGLVAIRWRARRT